MKRLIVTADDVGLSPGMSLGAVRAHDAGIVTAVAVVANGRAFEHAVEVLRTRPALDVGIHLTLVGERPLSPPQRLPSLVDRNGAFLPDAPAFARRDLLRRIAYAEVEAELRQQIERLLATGLPVVHASAHQHLHVLPRVFEVVLRLVEEHRIPWLRIPAEPAVGPLSTRSLLLRALNRYGRTARRRLPVNGRVRSPERTVGVAAAGHLTSERLREVLATVQGVSELVCHPGLGDAALAAEYDWGYGWDRETAALCDPRLPAELAAAGIELTSFSRLAGQEHRM